MLTALLHALGVWCALSIFAGGVWALVGERRFRARRAQRRLDEHFRTVQALLTPDALPDNHREDRAS